MSMDNSVGKRVIFNRDDVNGGFPAAVSPHLGPVRRNINRRRQECINTTRDLVMPSILPGDSGEVRCGGKSGKRRGRSVRDDAVFGSLGVLCRN